jgi:hypothetical protein
MFFFRQFETFDPVSGDVPESPFSYLPEIAGRARSILLGKTSLQFTAAAQRINQEIKRYFNDLKYVAVSDLKSKLLAEGNSLEPYFEWTGGDWDDGGSDECWKFNDDLVDDLEIPMASNCSEVDALKTIIDDRDSNFFLPEGAPEPEPNEYPEGKTVELFAVLALWLVADAIEWSKFGVKHGIALAGASAIKAMDAVCHAEHLRHIEWLVTYRKSISDAELAVALRKQSSEYQKAAGQERSDRAKQLNVRRHAKTNRAKEVVCTEWEKSPSQFPSAEKAGIHFAEWLASQKIVDSIEPRTVTGWIRAHAKQREIKFR